MKEKKNIERLFQESFKDFEVTPHDKNLEIIQKRLDKKENDRKLIPIWFKYAGVAAILLLFFVLGGKSLFEPKNNIPENKVVLDTPPNSSGENISTEPYKNSVVNTTTQDSNATSSKGKDIILEQNSQVVKTDGTSSNSDSNKTLFAPQNKNIGNRGVATNRKSSSTSEENSILGGNYIGQPNSSITKNTEKRKEENLLSNSISVNQKNSPTENSNSIEKGQVAIHSNPTVSKEPTTIGQEKDVLQTKEKEPFEKPQISEADIAVTNKPDEAVAKDEISSLTEIQKDSLTIEEAIAKTQDKDIDEEEKLVNRWQVYANIAPVYYNTLSDGSHLHEQFVNNPKSGELNTSYGVNVGYALNNRFTVRTGVRSLDLSYSTGNVILYESPGNTSVQTMLRNVSMANESTSHMTVLSSNNFSARDINSTNLFEGFDGSLTQNISYYEVPVEVEYNLINKKIGFQVIGGLSTFFLDNNEIHANVQGTKSYIGKANNINNMSFSANFGLGLDYNFSQKFKFNLEPTFKYQLNAFNNTSGNFRPYIIGLYTGFSYKF